MVINFLFTLSLIDRCQQELPILISLKKRDLRINDYIGRFLRNF